MSLTLYNEESRILQHMMNLVDSVLTQQSYKASVNEFLEWAQRQYYETPAEHVAAYKTELMETQSPATVNRKLTSVRKFFETAADLEYISLPMLAAVKRVKNVHVSGQKSRRWLSLEEAQELLDKPDINSRTGLRDRALLAVLLGTALRVSEITSLRWGNIQQVNETWVFENLSRKAGRVQSVPVPEWVIERILDYSERLPDEEYVFVDIKLTGEYGDKLSENGVRFILGRYSDNLSPHDLRATWAGLAEAGGASISSIQSILGHSNIATTDRYLAKLKPSENDAIYRTGLG